MLNLTGFQPVFNMLHCFILGDMITCNLIVDWHSIIYFNRCSVSSVESVHITEVGAKGLLRLVRECSDTSRHSRTSLRSLVRECLETQNAKQAMESWGLKIIDAAHVTDGGPDLNGSHDGA